MNSFTAKYVGGKNQLTYSQLHNQYSMKTWAQGHSNSDSENQRHVFLGVSKR